jgi:DNA-binding transcriptional regulator GbsR (MarR family)
MARSPETVAPPTVDEIVLQMCDMIGNIMEFWGFRKVLGRIWTLLYLSPQPLSAADMKEMLGMSVGNVSMAVKELERWGVIRRTIGPVARREYFEAETHLWKMISRVFRERERVYVENALEQMEIFKDRLQERVRSGNRAEAELTTFRKERIEMLMDAAMIALRLLDALVATARLDASPLRNLRLVKDLALGRKRKS